MYLCDRRFGGVGMWGYRKQRRTEKAVKPRDYKGSIWGRASKWSQEGDIMLPWILSGALHDVTTVPPPLVVLYTVIWFVGNAVNTNTWSPISHRSELSVTSLCFKSNSLRESDLWWVTLGNFIPLLTWVFGRDWGLKSSKRWKVIARPNRNVQ